MFSTSIAVGVWITMKVSDHLYEIGVKGQGEIYLKSVLWLLMRTSISFVDGWYLYLVH